MTTERKWQLRRMSDGSWGLPSNDLTVLWRIEKQDERDGTLFRGGSTRPVNGTFWRLLRWRHHYEDIAHEDVHDEQNWETIASLLPTRQAAIEAAMEREPEATCST